MNILKKIGVLFCMVGMLAESPAIAAWAASEIAELNIDSENRYTGMDLSYSEGYVPKVENDTACLIVPVVCQGQLKENSLKAALNPDSGTDMPFVSEK